MAKKEEKVVEELQKEVPIVKSVDTKDEVKNEPLKVKTPKRKMKDLNESSKSKITKVDLSKPVKREDDKESEVTKVDLSEKKEEESSIRKRGLSESLLAKHRDYILHKLHMKEKEYFKTDLYAFTVLCYYIPNQTKY